MNWARAIAGGLVLWSSTVGAATLTWNASGDPVAGYRVYQCSLLPCTKSADNLLVTLGAVTSFNIGTPAVTQYYFITAFDSANNESGDSSLATFTPVGSSSPPPTPPPMNTVRLTVVGNPAAGMWGVEGDTTDPRNVMATVLLDGVVHHVEHNTPYGFPDDNGLTATTGRFGTGPHTVEFVFYLEGTTTEIGRANVTVQEGCPSAPPPPAAMRNVNLTVVGFPAAGRWGVEGSTTDLRDVMATVFLDGVVHHVEHYAPYGFPDDNGITATMGQFGSGSHTVEFVFSLEGTTTEIGRANVTVQEGSL
jgi:hypothetical protein